jgi:hypothetical protein
MKPDNPDKAFSVVAVQLDCSPDEVVVSGRIAGRLTSMIRGKAADGRRLVHTVLSATAPAHCIRGDKYDLTYIYMNPLAAELYSTPGRMTRPT